MKCDHKTVQDVGSVTWCKRCGAVRENACLEWRLPESEQYAAHMAEMCPICEFGDPLPVEEHADHKIWRWSCGHWIDSRTAERLRKEKEESRL
jgi:hypothetical protein